MDIKELKAALERLEDLYGAVGAVAAAKDLRSVAHLLDGHEGQSVETFIAETRALLDKPDAPLSTVSFNVEAVNRYAGRLLNAGIDQKAFDDALSALDQDTLIGKAEWTAITNSYLNTPSDGSYVYKFKTIKAARAAIRDAFIERFEADSKRGIIERLTRWAS